MSASNQQNLAESRANDRPPILEKENYIPWESRFRRFLENKGEDEEQMLDSIRKVPYKRLMIASKEKRATRNHDLLTLATYASPSYSHSPQPYYVTHPSSVVDSEEDYQMELQGDAQEDKLTIAMMLLARATTQKLSTPTNNHLRTSSNTRNQAVIHDGRVEI
ncbi:hypothetical protein Tco_0522432 [Tanacetum coccineum]